MANKIPFILEIGTEEIPARFFAAVIPSLRDHTESIFEKNNIEYADVRSMATPRRLTVMANITNAIQKTEVSEVSGPPAKAAFDADGRPTKAAEGFAKSQGLKVSDLKLKETPKGPYVVAIKEMKGQKVSKVLPAIVPEIIKSMHFPKAMRWGSHNMRFVRPIRWILCLLDNSVVKFEIDGIRSGLNTYGHRLLSPKKIAVKYPGEYEKLLRKHHVIVDHVQRKEMIVREIDEITKKSGNRCITDEELLNAVNFLVEEPCGVLCSFRMEYLQLPPELLITVMKDHQKYFAMHDTKGKMVNSFVVISNTSRGNSKAVRQGAEKVIKARFEDARFYYTEDIKQKLIERRDILKGITFHEKLGTIYDKVRRIETIAIQITMRINSSLREKVAATAQICKSDLTTGVVREFPELQGITGYYYALQEGLPVEIAIAVKEHYKPLTMADSIPSSDIGRIVSIADKIDSIVAFFSVNIIPSGSEDPFALRRQAQGIVQILLSVPYEINIRHLIDISSNTFNSQNKELIPTLGAFFMQRIEFALLSSGYPEDIVKGITGDALHAPLHILPRKAEAIRQFKQSAGYGKFLSAIKRVRNILPDAARDSIDSHLLSHPAEKNLFKNLKKVSDALSEEKREHNYPGALSVLMTLTGAIHEFFDGVLVMDNDEKIKNNRIALLKKTWEAAQGICDFSQLSES